MSNFLFVDKGYLKLPELEDELDGLKRKNYQKKAFVHKLLGNNPLFNIILNKKSKIISLRLEMLKKKK